MIYNQFLYEKNPVIHRQAIQAILSEVDLAEPFNVLLEEKNGVESFFFLWERAGEEEKNPKEKDGLNKFGALSKELYQSKNYKELCDLFFSITLRFLAEAINLEKREDFEELKDIDLYLKDLIPAEIFLPFLIMESFIKQKNFDWDRGDEILKQNLACFIICFGDIQEFIHEKYK